LTQAFGDVGLRASLHLRIGEIKTRVSAVRASPAASTFSIALPKLNKNAIFA
jgi:hypothetical protein